MTFKELLIKKWPVSSLNLVWMASLVVTVVFNLSAFNYVTHNTDVTSLSGASILLTVVVVQFFLTFLFFSILALITTNLLKVFLVVTTIINSVALYYMVNFSVVIDKTMIGNIFNTRFDEAFELFSIKLVFYILVLGFLPLWGLSRIKVVRQNRGRLTLHTVGVVIVSLSLIYANSASWLWIDKYAKMLGGKLLPWSYIVNGAKHYAEVNHTTEGQLKLPDGQFNSDEKMLVVLVIGETARSDNFSLYGYNKNTTPRLAENKELVVIKNTQSCTTYTTASIACMLAAFEDNNNHEFLPTYLWRHGTEVIWRTTNWGEPPIEVSKYQKRQELRTQCDGQECMYDGVLLAGLKAEIENSTKNKIFVVLHMKGSHGPSYYTRYPQAFERFTPVCMVEEVSKCSEEELVNAYDNTIVYTDHVLAETIDTLKSISSMPSMMIYISDHGESLGEHGVYLHGTPFTFAPDVQKNIPFLIWRSDQLKLPGKAHLTNPSASFSQHHVFHTILGAFEFDSAVYDEHKDIFKPY